MLYRHYIITPFNCLGQPPRAEWLRARLDLFEMVTQSCMLKQECKDFRWLWIFSPGTDDEDLSRATRLASWHSNVEMLLANEETVVAVCADHIRKETQDDLGILLATTRLDSDDALGLSAVRQLQQSFVWKDKWVIYFKSGKWFVYPEMKVSDAMCQDPDVCPTLLEIPNASEGGGICTVMGLRRRNMREAPAIVLQDRGMWLKTFHDQSLQANTKRAASVSRPIEERAAEDLKQSFGLPKAFTLQL